MRGQAWQKNDWLILVVLAGAISVFYARGLRPGYAFLPLDNVQNNLPWRSGPFVLGDLQNPLIGDPIFQFYPFLAHAVESARAGVWPLWHSQLMLGHPLAGDPLAQTFYPVFLGLGLVFGPARGLTVGFWLHALLAAGLTYGWLRTLVNHRAAAALGALTYALGGFMVTWFETTFWVSTLSWLPGVLWMAELAWAERRWRYVAGGALMLGFAALAGQVSFVLGFGVALGLYGVGRMVEAVRASGSAWRWQLLSLVVLVSLGALLSGAQLLPFQEALNQSHRAGGMSAVTLPWPQAITWLVPNFYGNPSTTRAYWGASNFSEGVLYAGIVGWLLAVLAGLCLRRFLARYLFVSVVAIGYVVFGGPGVSVINQLPLLNYLNLGRLAFLAPLLVAPLAALTLAEPRLSLRWGLAAGLLLGALIAWAVVGNWGNVQAHWAEVQGPLALAMSLLVGAVIALGLRERWPSWRAHLDWALVALVFADLYLFGSGYNPALPLTKLPTATPAIEYLQSHAGLYRVATQQRSGEIIFGPNYLSTFGVADLSGYSSLLPKRLLQLDLAGDPASMGYNGNTIWLGQPSLRLLDLLQAKYLVSEHPLADPVLKTEFANYACERHSAEVTAAQPTSGAFTVRGTAINRLDLVFFLTTQNHEPLTVRMWQGAERNRLVLESAVASGQLQNQQPATFFFAPETDAPGQSYVWEVTTTAEHSGASLCAASDGHPAIGLYGAEWAQAYSGEVYIAERLAPLPRAYVVYAAETLSDDAQMLSRVLDETFDIRHSALTIEDVGLPSTPPQLAQPATIESYADTRIVIRATAAQAGLLVLGDYDYPGWMATLDGQAVPIVRTNWLWRGVKLPPGEHTVVFQFTPASVRYGLGLSGVGVLLMLLLCVIDYRAARR